MAIVGGQIPFKDSKDLDQDEMKLELTDDEKKAGGKIQKDRGSLVKSLSVTSRGVTISTTWIYTCRTGSCSVPCDSQIAIADEGDSGSIKCNCLPKKQCERE